MTGRRHVIVIGGGYAGVTAADRLTRRDDLMVTLINPRPMFVERIRLHQSVCGSDDAVVDYRHLLGSRVRLLVDTVTRIDASARKVILGGGGALGYDRLIYAVGSGSADPRVPGAAQFSHPIASLEQAQRLREVLATKTTAAPVTVVGAGPTGIETAAELAECGRSVTLVCGEVLGPYLHARGRRAVAGELARLGVTVLDGAGSRVVTVGPDAVRLADGREVASAVTVWTAGFAAPDLALRSGLSTDSAGRLLTDETLTSVDDACIVAAGDCAAPSDVPLRMSCQAAAPLGAHAAETVLHRIAGEQPRPVAIGFVGQCISLGRRAGVFQFARRNDTVTRFYLAGRLAAKLKAFICWGTVKQLGIEARRPGLLTLSFGSKHERQRMLAARTEAVRS
ncbi:MAG TPA: FAD-dependent oxidoreductase [Humibacter sp.]|nr:FAD-dependent oxidoreductase [Humibacter sp.]